MEGATQLDNFDLAEEEAALVKNHEDFLAMYQSMRLMLQVSVTHLR